MSFSWQYIPYFAGGVSDAGTTPKCILERGGVTCQGSLKIQWEYERIMESEVNDREKDKQLAKLMTQMEGEYRIPMLQVKEWEEKNKPVIAMYRQLSMSRKTV